MPVINVSVLANARISLRAAADSLDTYRPNLWVGIGRLALSAPKNSPVNYAAAASRCPGKRGHKQIIDFLLCPLRNWLMIPFLFSETILY